MVKFDGMTSSKSVRNFIFLYFEWSICLMFCFCLAPIHTTDFYENANVLCNAPSVSSNALRQKKNTIVNVLCHIVLTTIKKKKKYSHVSELKRNTSISSRTRWTYSSGFIRRTHLKKNHSVDNHRYCDIWNTGCTITVYTQEQKATTN